MGMTRFSGVLQRPNSADTNVLIQVSDGKCTVVASPGRWIGAWPLEKLIFERRGPREFTFPANGQEWTFISDNPAGFSEAVGVMVDLRPTTSRFGLGERVKAAKAEQRRDL